MGIRDLVAVCASFLWHLCVLERDRLSHKEQTRKNVHNDTDSQKRACLSLPHSLYLFVSERIFSYLFLQTQKALEVKSCRKGLKRSGGWISSIKAVSMSKLLIIVWHEFMIQTMRCLRISDRLIHTSTEFTLKPKVLLNAYTIHVLGQIGYDSRGSPQRNRNKTC